MKRLKRKKIEDYIGEENQGVVLNIVNYYGYSLTFHHFLSLYDVYKKTNKNRDSQQYDYNSDFSDLNELWLIKMYIDKDMDPCPWVSPSSFIRCNISERWSSLILNCERRLNENYVQRVLIPLFKKLDMPIIIASISFLISIITLIISIIALFI